MATTQNTYTGNGSTTNYSFTFEYLKQADVKVTLNTAATTAYTFANATTLAFTTAPANGVAIRIFRDTPSDTLSSTFFPGSAIKAEDLNENFTQNLYVTQESDVEAAAATTTANTAKTTSETALTNSSAAVTSANSAVTTANSAVTTANTANTTASSAVTTANSSVSTANSAVTTANGAVTTANGAVTTANAADTKADTAISDASSAVSTANTASTNATSAVTTANTANTNAAAAVSTANTASTNATTAVNTANTASTNASAAVTTANSASSTATTASSDAASAITTANTASTNATAAVNTANTASTNATSAVSTANTADTNASAAVVTANTANTTANTANTTAGNAVTTANGAVTTANTADTNATAAVSTANTASTNATTAVNTANAANTTANTANTNSSAAVATANTASTNASNAVTTANTANTTATAALTNSRESDGSGGFTSAISKANTAITTANTASAAVSNAVLFELVTNVASIPGSPSNNDYVEIGNSTGIQSFSPLSGLPSGFVGANGITVRLRYDSSASTWAYMSYFANDSETRYLTKNIPVVTGDSTNGSGQITLNCENNSHGVKIKGPPHSAGANYTLTLPNDDGTSSQVLSTNGSGVLSWVSQPDISGKADTSAVNTSLATKANISGPTFTGVPAAPTASSGTNTTQLATTEFVTTAVNNTIDSAPGALNTLNELAAALNDDANFSSTVTNLIGANETHIDNTVTLTGVAKDATNLGTFTGSTITDNQTIKASLQLLETKVEAVQSDVDGNESDSDSAIAAVQADVNANEAAALTARNAIQADVDQNEADADTAIALKANIASPTFTGTVAIPNIANLETAVTANTAKVTNATHTGDVTGSTTLTIAAGAVETGMIADDAVTADKLANSINTDIAAKAPLASPTFTGTPAAPTASQGTNTTQVATTAFVNAEIAADLTAAIGSTVQAYDADTAKRDTTNTYTQLQTMNAGLSVDGPYKQVAEAVGSTAIDLSTGNYFTKTISGNTTFSFSNPPSSGTVGSFTLELTHSSGTVTWPSSVKFPADTAPTLTTGKTHLFIFVTDDGGSRYRGAALVDYVN